MRVFAASFLWVLFAASCSKTLSTDELMDPESCKGCHPSHFEQWSGSMHAYAADDPVFLAMNARGQRETDGALGDFCVKCHAPMAIKVGATTDGLNLPEVPQHLKGVTCFFCHQVDAVEGDHNAPIRLAEDNVMRGPIDNPVDNDAHDSKYSALHDRNDLRSSDLCGSCHDIVTPAGVHLERTFLEWKGTLFAHDNPAERLTCSACHMQGRDGLAADAEGVGQRRIHSHAWPGVDIALTQWPQRQAQQALIQEALDNTLLAQLCVLTTTSGATISVDLENVAAGHGWPSGATQDRRAWIEVTAYRVRDVIYQSGAVPDDMALTSLEDPDLWRLGDEMFDADNNPVHMFWEVDHVTGLQLPGMAARLPTDSDYVNTHLVRSYHLSQVPDRVTVRVKIRPIGLDVLDSLIDSGDLDPAFRPIMPTFTLSSTELEWTSRSLFPCVPEL